MSAALHLSPPMTVTAFLEWEEAQPIRYEFDGERAVAMAGGSLDHATIATNLLAALVTRLRGRPCRARNSDAKVQVDGKIRYPDASVTCSEQADRVRARQGVVHAPVVVFEVLSDSTAATDRTEKNAEYRATPSILHYVMLEHERIAATVFSRVGEDWVGRLVLGEGAVLTLPEIGITALNLADLYDGVNLPGTNADDAAA